MHTHRHTRIQTHTYSHTHKEWMEWLGGWRERDVLHPVENWLSARGIPPRSDLSHTHAITIFPAAHSHIWIHRRNGCPHIQNKNTKQTHKTYTQTQTFPHMHKTLGNTVAHFKSELVLWIGWTYLPALRTSSIKGRCRSWMTGVDDKTVQPLRTERATSLQYHPSRGFLFSQNDNSEALTYPCFREW